MENNFAIFILSHGRSNNVLTHKTLKDFGYTGKIYIIIDDEDKQKDEYLKKYGKEVIIFSKKDYEGTFDIMDNFDNNKVIVYARNACYDIARKLGLDYFFEYEDDYVSFSYRYQVGNSLKALYIKKFDDVVKAMIKIMQNTSIYTIAFSQGGDFIGGVDGSFTYQPFKRKAMNTFIFRVNKDPKDDLKFIGRMNDDVNTYLTQGKVGNIFIQFPHYCLIQVQTQSNDGGNTEIYKKFGTYVKSFYSVMAEPSCCRIALMGGSDKRIHHRINWNNACPCIIREEVKNNNYNYDGK